LAPVGVAAGWQVVGLVLGVLLVVLHPTLGWFRCLVRLLCLAMGSNDFSFSCFLVFYSTIELFLVPRLGDF